MGVCLLIHGFTGSPQELEPLAQLLHSRGHQVVSPTLAGHGKSRMEMERVTWVSWIHSVEVVLQDLLKKHDQVHVVGFSMGGLIAGYLSRKYHDHIRSLSMLSAPIYTINPKQLFKTIAEAIQKSMRAGGRHEDVNRYLAKMKGTPPRSLVHFRRLVQTVKPLLADLECPILIVQGELDDLVETRSADYIYETVKSTDKTLKLFPQSRHLICHDCEAEEVIDLVAAFIEQHEE
jgi:carboxylesterase